MAKRKKPEGNPETSAASDAVAEHPTATVASVAKESVAVGPSGADALPDRVIIGGVEFRAVVDPCPVCGTARNPNSKNCAVDGHRFTESI
jgi:hypothetical protein